MPMVYGQWGPGFPQAPGNAAGNPALDALRQLGSLSATSSGSRGPINDHRLTESDNWGRVDGQYPPPATPPEAQSGRELLLNSLRMAPNMGARFQKGGPQHPATEQ